MGRRWLIVSPAQKLRLGQLLNMKPMSLHLSWAGQSKWHLCAAQPVPPQQCYTATNVLECSKLGSLQVYACPLQQKEDKLPMVCSTWGICLIPTSQSNCKTKPWTPWESGAKPSVHWLGTDKEQTSDTTTLLGVPAWLRAAPSSGTHQAVLRAVLQFLLHPTQPCSASAARRDSRSHLLRAPTHRRLLCEGNSEFHGLAVLNYKSVN